MRYAILGDIHSNIEALDAVLEAVAHERPDAVLCTGDLVGYGAAPRECVRRIRELAPAGLVAGNHDWAAAGRLGLEFFNAYARESILWTRARLSRDELEYLGSHPPLVVAHGITIAHGTVHDAEQFDYLQSSYDAHLSFTHMTTRYGFVGHSHVPVTFKNGALITYSLGEEVDVSQATKALINVGSVGQPRDEDPRAAYGIFDDVGRTVAIRRVEYDVDASIARIREAGLPEFLGERLRIGR